MLTDKTKSSGAVRILRTIFNRARNILQLPIIGIWKLQAIKSSKEAFVRPPNANHAVFVCDQINVRAIKLAFALTGKGWKITLLHREELPYDVSDFFFETKKIKHRWDALLLASRSSAGIYHVFSNYHFELASMFTRYKPGKVVFDSYDLLTGMFKDAASITSYTDLEQYCYTHADGICSRDLRIQYLIKLGYKLPKRILFSEYCWPEKKFIRSPKLNDGIHVVYVGSIEPNPESPVGYLYELASHLSSAGIHLHIYPSHMSIINLLKTNMLRFLTPDVIEKYVHIHETISLLTLREEISKYHYGILISSKTMDFGEDNETYFEHMGDYFLPSKSFDYLDAGLFTLSQNAKYVRFMLERYKNGCVVSSFEEIVEICKHKPPGKVVVPSALLLESNADRLVKFYLSL